MNRLTEVIARNSRKIEPDATGVEVRLKPIDGLQAVFFDVYGTLLVSGSGDVGTSMQMTKASALIEALSACQIEFRGDHDPMIEFFYQTIREEHEVARKQGIQYPEIEIDAIWKKVFDHFRRSGELAESAEFDPLVFALEFETRVNPVWPMPGFREILEFLNQQGLKLGIVSNAQFFTPQILEYFLGSQLEKFGISPENCFYSYQYRTAKPGLELYEKAAMALGNLGIDQSNCLYVGNDMLNDIYPASQVGMKTALFAGDRRSLRLRKDDDRTKTLQPDLILNDLRDLISCLPS